MPCVPLDDAKELHNVCNSLEKIANFEDGVVIRLQAKILDGDYPRCFKLKNSFLTKNEKVFGYIRTGMSIRLYLSFYDRKYRIPSKSNRKEGYTLRGYAAEPADYMEVPDEFNPLFDYLLEVAKEKGLKGKVIFCGSNRKNEYI